MIQNREVSRSVAPSAVTTGLMSRALARLELEQRISDAVNRRWCSVCRGVGAHYTQGHPSEPVLGTLRPRLGGVRVRG